MMKNQVLFFAVAAVGGASITVCSHFMPSAPSQPAVAPSVQSLKAANQRLEAKIRSMQAQTGGLQRLLGIARLQMQALKPNVRSFYPAPLPPRLYIILDSRVVFLSNVSH